MRSLNPFYYNAMWRTETIVGGNWPFSSSPYSTLIYSFLFSFSCNSLSIALFKPRSKKTKRKKNSFSSITFHVLLKVMNKSTTTIAKNIYIILLAFSCSYSLVTVLPSYFSILLCKDLLSFLLRIIPVCVSLSLSGHTLSLALDVKWEYVFVRAQLFHFENQTKL